MEGFVYLHANTLLTVAEAERAAKLNLIAKVMLCDQSLQSLNNRTRALNVAGASNTYRNFHKKFLAYIFLFFIIQVIHRRAHGRYIRV
jgi:hypothetical protein